MSIFGMNVAHRMHLAQEVKEADQAAAAKRVAQASAKPTRAQASRPVTKADFQRLLAEHNAELAAINEANRTTHVLQPAAVVQKAPAKPVSLAGLSSMEKIARGLSETVPARGTVIHSNQAQLSEDFQAREQRLARSDAGMARSTLNILNGLKASQPARGTPKPAA